MRCDHSILFWQSRHLLLGLIPWILAFITLVWSACSCAAKIKAKCAAYIPPHSASSLQVSGLQVNYAGYTLPPRELGIHFTNLRRIEG